MTNAVTYLIEPLLTQYFLIDATCNGFIEEHKKIEVFEELSKVFLVPINDETLEYFHVANSGQYKNITDYAAYERLCRMIEFAGHSSQSVDLTLIDRVVLAQKREAMLIKSELFKQSKNLTADIIADTLQNTAMNGNVDAMALLSYMEYHGICIGKDVKSAIKRISLCAKWNNLFGNLMGIAYDEKNKQEYYNTLYTVLRSSNQREVFEYICKYTEYGKEFEKSPTAKILEKAFALGIIKRNVYDRVFAKAAFSELISCEDKEKLLLTKKKDAIACLTDIPFDAGRSKKYSFDKSKIKKVPLKREIEIEQILCSLSPAVNGKNSLYQVLLVAGDDRYISEMYAGALKNGFEKKNKVLEIDASTLSMRDFAAAKENFILRGLSETKDSHTVFLIKNCEELGKNEFEELVKLLGYDYRRKFKLLDPTVSLDLGDILLVLFASDTNENVQRLAKECDVVWTDKISDEEKSIVIDSTFKARSKSFGIARATLDDEGRRYLAPFRTGQIIRIIDNALKKAAYDNETIITAKSLREIISQQGVTTNKREFGYLGGIFHEEY